MAPEDRPQQPPKKVVAKKVVKKTVARPAAPVPPPTAIQIGRARRAPSAAVKQKARQTTPSRPAPSAPERVTTTVPRPKRQLGKKAGAAGRSFGAGAGKVAGTAGHGLRRGAGVLGHGVADTFWRVVDWRPPVLPVGRVGAFVGVLDGLLTVLVVGGFKMLFEQVRGTSTGGGHWGFWTVVLVIVIAVLLGEVGLRGLHVPQPRVTSLVATFATIVLVLLIFSSVIDSGWAWLILPSLGAVTFGLSARVMAAADEAPQPEE